MTPVAVRPPVAPAARLSALLLSVRHRRSSSPSQVAPRRQALRDGYRIVIAIWVCLGRMVILRRESTMRNNARNEAWRRVIRVLEDAIYGEAEAVLV